VPLFEKTKAILEKYKHLETPLPLYTNQFINEQIKDIAKQANLDRIIKLVKYYDNVIKEERLKLHEVISTHCARKTFISLSLQKGAPERMVREVSGHKDDRSFRRYVNYNKKHLDIIRKLWEC
jgi:integrase